MASFQSSGKASSMWCNPATDPSEMTERLMMASSRNARIPVVKSHDDDRTLFRYVGAQFGEAMQSSGTVATKNEFEAGLGRDLEEERKVLGERVVVKELK